MTILVQVRKYQSQLITHSASNVTSCDVINYVNGRLSIVVYFGLPEGESPQGFLRASNP